MGAPAATGRLGDLLANPGAALLAATAAALAWANSPFAHGYHVLWDTPIALRVGGEVLELSLHHWINDGLMAMFFFTVGLEIKREVLVGHLSAPSRAALPIIAAAGGMAVPALIHLLVNLAPGGVPRAWGVPIATDIAFALGVLSLVRGVPVALRVYLTALAIADDLGGVLVIALTYSEGVAWDRLLAGVVVLAASWTIARMRVRWPVPYAVLGLALWLIFVRSGVHATIAGVLMALTIPTRAAIDPKAFAMATRALIDRFDDAGGDHGAIITNGARQESVHRIERHCERIRAPLQRIEDGLHPWVAWGVLPLFALANAGVAIDASALASAASPLALGIAAGLLVGKPIGVVGATWLAVRTGVATLPEGVRWQHIRAAGWLAGIGFTMSLFIAGLALPDAAQREAAKLAVLAASAVAGCVGWRALRAARR